MKGNTGTNRRTFLQGLGFAWSAFRSSAAPNTLQPAYRYAGLLRPEGRDGIEVFRFEKRRWICVQQVPSSAPVSLAIHPNRSRLYAANQVSTHQGLPRGTVEVFSIQRETGALSHLQRQVLSLSGTEPRTLTVAPDGRHLVVAVYGGGAYNVLPIREDGSLNPVAGIFKELGCGAHPEHQASAHPHTVLFDQAGQFLLASDFGCDHLSVFTLTGDGQLERRSRVSVESGAGPGAIARHPSGSWLYALHELTARISCHRYDSVKGVIGDGFQQVTLADAAGFEVRAERALKLASTGRFLYASLGAGASAFEIDDRSGYLSFANKHRLVQAYAEAPSSSVFN